MTVGDGRPAARAVSLRGRRAWPASTQAQPENRGGRARRLRTRRAESAIRRRSVVSARLQARAIRGNRHGDNVARAVGRGADGRPRRSHGQGMRAAGERRPEGEDRDPRRALFMRRRETLRRSRQAAHRGGPQSQPGQILRHQARGKPQTPCPVWRFDLPARAADQGRRRRPARSSHRDVAGEGQVQGPFARRAGAEGRDHRARSGRSDRGARFSVAGAQFAAFSDRPPFRSDHLRDAGTDRADFRAQAGGRTGGGLGADARVLPARIDDPSFRRGLDRARDREQFRRTIFSPHADPQDSPRRNRHGQSHEHRAARFFQTRSAQSDHHLRRPAGAERRAFRAAPTSWCATILV